jgi:hypothetical protein
MEQQITIYLKSGQNFDVQCSYFAVSRSELTGQLTQISFRDMKPRIMHIDLNEIAAIVDKEGGQSLVVGESGEGAT